MLIWFDLHVSCHHPSHHDLLIMIMTSPPMHPLRLETEDGEQDEPGASHDWPILDSWVMLGQHKRRLVTSKAWSTWFLPFSYSVPIWISSFGGPRPQRQSQDLTPPTLQWTFQDLQKFVCCESHVYWGQKYQNDRGNIVFNHLWWLGKPIIGAFGDTPS